MANIRIKTDNSAHLEAFSAKIENVLALFHISQPFSDVMTTKIIANKVHRCGDAPAVTQKHVVFCRHCL